MVELILNNLNENIFKENESLEDFKKLIINYYEDYPKRKEFYLNFSKFRDDIVKKFFINTDKIYNFFYAKWSEDVIIINFSQELVDIKPQNKQREQIKKIKQKFVEKRKPKKKVFDKRVTKEMKEAYQKALIECDAITIDTPVEILNNKKEKIQFYKGFIKRILSATMRPLDHVAMFDNDYNKYMREMTSINYEDYYTDAMKTAIERGNDLGLMPGDIIQKDFDIPPEYKEEFKEGSVLTANMKKELGDTDVSTILFKGNSNIFDY